MQEDESFNEYYWKVAGEAVGLGYSIQIVRIFYNDILDYYHDGKSVEEAVEEIF